LFWANYPLFVSPPLTLRQFLCSARRVKYTLDNYIISAYSKHSNTLFYFVNWNLSGRTASD
ncbi:hypothetical protein, partial [Robinsoniella sp.]|uniref:hypothetical protein n=1 Tax=Robinsoniella sp. TaxID=2496533 RepID=UPI0037535131